MNLIDLKERIAISDDYTPTERDFLLDSVNAAAAALRAVARGDKPLDHTDAIAIGIETLGFRIGDNLLERRAKASLIEQSLTLCGFKIVPIGG